MHLFLPACKRRLLLLLRPTITLQGAWGGAVWDSCWARQLGSRWAFVCLCTLFISCSPCGCTIERLRGTGEQALCGSREGGRAHVRVCTDACGACRCTNTLPMCRTPVTARTSSMPWDEPLSSRVPQCLHLYNGWRYCLKGSQEESPRWEVLGQCPRQSRGVALSGVLRERASSWGPEHQGPPGLLSSPGCAGDPSLPESEEPYVQFFQSDIQGPETDEDLPQDASTLGAERGWVGQSHCSALPASPTLSGQCQWPARLRTPGQW